MGRSISFICVHAVYSSAHVSYRQLQVCFKRAFIWEEHFTLAQHIHQYNGNCILSDWWRSIPEQQRLRFIKETGKDTVIFEDSETLATLETYFSLDCNVSETAKRLFIHRNTLIYRLDKIKQEIGYDVRSFESAVLVRLFAPYVQSDEKALIFLCSLRIVKHHMDGLI